MFHCYWGASNLVSLLGPIQRGEGLPLGNRGHIGHNAVADADKISRIVESLCDISDDSHENLLRSELTFSNGLH